MPAGVATPTPSAGGATEAVLDPSVALLKAAHHGQQTDLPGELLLFSQGQGDLTLLQLQPTAAADSAAAVGPQGKSDPGLPGTDIKLQQDPPSNAYSYNMKANLQTYKLTYTHSQV
jgi:hypothetical protein